MSKSCGNDDCLHPLAVSDVIVPCAGSCPREFHLKCTGMTDDDYEVLKKYKNVTFRCDSCLALGEEMKKSVDQINTKINRILTSVISKQSQMEVALSERIGKVENLLQESGKTVINEMSRVVDKVTKVVEEKSSEMSRVLDFSRANETVMVDNENEWTKIEKKKKKKDKVVLITPAAQQSRINLKKSLRTSIDASKLRVNGMSNAAKNGIAVECDDEESCDKLMEELKEKFGEEVEAKRPRKFTPRIKMLRVNDPEIADIHFISQLKHHNECLKDATITVIRREIVRKRGQVVAGVFNMVLEIDEPSYDKVMAEQKLKHHFEVYKVVDNIYIRRCYKCFGFNHQRDECRNDLACSRCAESHDGRECQAVIKKCINCIKFNERCGTNFDVNHDAWASHCEVFKQQLERSRKKFAHIK